MFGKNETEPLLKGHDGLSLDVVEVFPTIQGEGPHAGVPAVFVRLAGCHLKCYFCDTDFTSKRKVVDIETLAAQVFQYPIKQYSLVVITGGEPLRQNVTPFIRLVQRGHRQVQIETAGSFAPLEELPLGTQIVVSPKTAHVNAIVENDAICWKYLVGADTQIDPVDGLPLSSTQEHGRKVVLARPPGHPAMHYKVWLQPMDHGADKDATQAAIARCVDLCMRHGYRLSLQQHKIIGLP